MKKENLILYDIIPGPKGPKDIYSFLNPIIDEFKKLEKGIQNVYDTSTNTIFTLRIHLIIISDDLPIIMKVMGISGINSYEYYRFCKIRDIYEKYHIYYPL